MIFTANEFINRLRDVEKHKTIYSMGTFGWVCTPSNINRTKKNPYNTTPAQIIVYENVSRETFMFDCIGLVKGVLWGWYGDTNRVYGGAGYQVNGVPDTDAKKMLNYCTDVSTDFSDIVAGEFLWMDGHCGVYMGGGLVIESTPRWDGGVQYSYLANIGCTQGKSRMWTKHGKLQWIDYSASVCENVSRETLSEPVYITAVKGDSLSKIAKNNNLTLPQIKELNPQVKAPRYTIYVGQKIRIR